MPRRLNAWQSEPQQAGLNVNANLSTLCHVHCSFNAGVYAASISMQSAFNVCYKHYVYAICKLQIICIIGKLLL